jgi:hypothetical protein
MADPAQVSHLATFAMLSIMGMGASVTAPMRKTQHASDYMNAFWKLVLQKSVGPL